MAGSLGMSSDRSPFYIDNDEEIYSCFASKSADVNAQLDPLFQRIRQDPVDCAPWTRWVDKCKADGIQVSSYSLYEVEKPQISQKIPASFETAAGKAHLKSVQAICQVEEAAAVQITLSCMRDVPSQPDKNVYGSHALLERVIDYAYRQRIARLRVMAEALRAECGEHDDSHRAKCQKLLDDLDQKSTASDGGKRGIFMFLLLTACLKDTDLTREQLLPAKQLWVRSVDEKRDGASKDTEWRALGHRIMDRHKRHVLLARKEALEALVVLLYKRFQLTRADYAILLTAFEDQNYFAHFSEIPRLGYLAGVICVEACALVETTKDGDWVSGHILFHGTDQCFAEETQALVRKLELALETSANKPQGLALFSFGCLLHLAGKSEGRGLAAKAFDMAEADVYFEECMAELVVPPSMEKDVLDFNWLDFTERASGYESDMDVDDDEDETELSGACMIYASVGRELVVALISTFHEDLDPEITRFTSNLNAIVDLVKAVHRNSKWLCLQVWEDWNYLQTRELQMQNPLCRVIHLAKDLAQRSLRKAKQLQSFELLEGVAPLLKLMGSLIFNSVLVVDVVEGIIPRALLQTCFLACLSTSSDPQRLQQWREDFLESILSIVTLARDDESRMIIRERLQGVSSEANSSSVGPQFLFQIAKFSGSINTLRLVTMIVVGLLPGAPPEWFFQSTFGLDMIRKETKGGLLGREKGPTEALVHLTHTLLLNMNKIFFATGVADRPDKMQTGLDELTNALSAVMNILSSATSAMSGNTFDGKPLSHQIATKIMVTLGNALIILRPMYFTHPSDVVQRAVSGIIDAFVHDITSKAGVGDSVLYFATLPAALGLAYKMRETVKDAELVRAVRGNSSHWGVSSSSAALSTNLQSLLTSLVSDIGKVSINLDLMETEGIFGEDSAKDVRLVSTAALRLLLLVSERGDYIISDSGGVQDCKAHEIIFSEALPPFPVRKSTELSGAWSASRIRYIQLFLRQLRMGKNELPISTATFALLGNYIDCNLRDLTWALGSLPTFRSVINETFRLLKDEIGSGQTMRASEAKVAAACVRTLTRCIESKINIFDVKRESEKWNVLIDFVSSRGKLEAPTDEIVLCDECLQLLLTLRKRQVAQGDGDYFKSEGTLMSTLATIGLENSKSSIVSSNRSESFTVDRSKCVHFVSTALRFLTVELHKETTGSQSAVLSAIKHALSQRLLSRWAENVLTLKSVPNFMEELIALRSSIEGSSVLQPDSLSDVIRLYGAQYSAATLESLFFWLASIRGSSQFVPPYFPQKLYRVLCIYLFLKEEMTCSVSAASLIFLLCEDDVRLGSVTGSSKASLSLVVSDCLNANTAGIMDAATKLSIFTLVAEVSEISGEFSLLLAGLTSGNATFDTEDKLKIMNILLACCGRALTHLGGQRKHCLLVEKLLLVTMQLSKSLKCGDKNIGKDGQNRLKEIVNIQSELARTACHVVRKLDRRGSAIWQGDEKAVREVSRCFRTCISFLRQACTMANLCEEPKYFSSVLCRTLIESDISSALVCCLNDLDVRKRIGPEGVLSVFDLFQALSTFGNKQVLSSLFSSGIRSALAANFKAMSDPGEIAGVYLRGYISLRSIPERWTMSKATRPGLNQPSLQLGRDDILHEIQMASTSFIANSLRNIAYGKIVADDTSKAVRAVALDFLGNSDNYFLACLSQVSRIPFDSDSEVRTLTMRSVREASTILALIAELCRRHNVDEFKRRFPGLFQSFVKAAYAIAGSMCSFLGASVSSRELFRALGDDDSGSQGTELGLGPLADVISLSLSNARHEAIRFSHFVSRWSAAITEKEHDLLGEYTGAWKPSPRKLSVDDPHSESVLEQKCKSSINNKFAYTLEEQVGRCLFHAADIIWKTHPTMSSFVMFSEAEVQRMEPAKLAPIGTVIGFRETDDSGAHLGIRYGEVNHIDIIRRVFTVTLLGSSLGRQPQTVSFNHLVGIEDISFRKPALHFAPAPENSAELERMGTTMSVGHLIAGLRWCKEYSSQFKDQHLSSDLAEILSVLLGTEVSLARREPHRLQNGRVDKKVVSILPIQLLDLYGVDEELCVDDSRNSCRPRDGRLRQLLPLETWDAIRDQIRPELDDAIADLRSRRDKKRGRSSEEEGWLVAYRRSPSNPRSPFRQVSI